MLLSFNPDQCTGCLNCVLTCAQERGGAAGPSLARIRIDLDIFGGPHGISICRQCEKAACAEACPTVALSPDQAGRWRVTAHIKGTCLSFNGITCRACDENCEEGAIRFRLMT
ncbi:TPA: hypothetical protein EYP84_00755, partial [Candidatus Bipolaricaulota bacterium]|nr:hypothetical protein [Candidatus Bipolaricaulota bacterium]